MKLDREREHPYADHPDQTDMHQMVEAVYTLSTAMRGGQLITARMLERTMEAASSMDATRRDLAVMMAVAAKRSTEMKRSEEQIRPWPSARKR